MKRVALAYKGYFCIDISRGASTIAERNNNRKLFAKKFGLLRNNTYLCTSVRQMV